jgi:hypothetical protein
MELVEKIMELSYHSTHADQWRRITVQRREESGGLMEVCEDGMVVGTYYDDHWDEEGADVVSGERWDNDDLIIYCDDWWHPNFPKVDYLGRDM